MTYFPTTSSATTISSLTDAGALALTDRDALNRGGTDYSTSMANRIVLMRKTPAGSRTTALPATLTATDNDKNIVLTGTTGSLTVDGTVADGWRCGVVNSASGPATLSGMTGIPSGTTTIPAARFAEVFVAGATVYAEVKAAASVAPTETLSITNIPEQTPSTSFTVSGTYTNGPPSALQYSDDYGSTWTNATSATIGSGAFSFTHPGQVIGSYSLAVRDKNNTSVIGYSNFYGVASSSETLTIDTITSPSANTSFQVSGTVANGFPSAYQYSVNGGTTWLAPTNWSGYSGGYVLHLPGLPAGTYTVMVRDANLTTATATSNSFTIS